MRDLRIRPAESLSYNFFLYVKSGNDDHVLFSSLLHFDCIGFCAGISIYHMRHACRFAFPRRDFYGTYFDLRCIGLGRRVGPIEFGSALYSRMIRWLYLRPQV